jgi:DNA-binding transcriptional MerR regulator
MALTIGQLAKSTGVGARTIRFYEAAGVLPAPSRATSGYRQYTMEAVHQLIFVRRARALGLSLRHLKTLLAAGDGGARGPVRPRVQQVVRAHLRSTRSARTATSTGGTGTTASPPTSSSTASTRLRATTCRSPSSSGSSSPTRSAKST